MTRRSDEGRMPGPRLHAVERGVHIGDECSHVLRVMHYVPERSIFTTGVGEQARAYEVARWV